MVLDRKACLPVNAVLSSVGALASWTGDLMKVGASVSIWTRTSWDCPCGGRSRGPLLKSPTNPFFFVATEIGGWPRLSNHRPREMVGNWPLDRLRSARYRYFDSRNIVGPRVFTWPKLLLTIKALVPGESLAGVRTHPAKDSDHRTV